MRTTPPPISDFSSLSLPTFENVTLDNGIRLHYLDAGKDQITRLALIWGAGTLDVDSPSALSLMASMIPEGASELSGEEISDCLESNGAWLKVYETPHAIVAVLHALNHTAPVVFPLFAKVLSQASFPSDALETFKQKGAADKRLAMERPSFRAAVASRKALYGDTPLGRVITPETIMAVQQEDLVELHRNLILSAKPEIFIAGAVSDEILNMLKISFGTLDFFTNNPQKVNFNSVEPPMIDERKRVNVDMPASLQTAIKYHIPTIGKDHPDFNTLRLAVMILGGYFGSRLMNNLREEHGYTYGVSAQLVFQADAASISITTDCDNRYAEACLEEIDKEIQRLATEIVGREELTTAKQIVISSLSSVLDTPITIEAYREMLAVNHQDESAFRHYFDSIVNVTAEDIRRVTAQYILNAPGVVATAGGPVSKI